MNKRVILYGVLGLIWITGATLLTYNWSYQEKYQRLEAASFNEIDRHVALIGAELGKFRALPALLAQSHEKIAFMLRFETRPGTEDVNQILRGWSDVLGAKSVFLLDNDGRLAAASDYSQTASLEQLSRSHLYQAAQQGRLGRDVRIDLENNIPDYFFSYTLRFDQEVIGVVVLQLSLDDVIETMRLSLNNLYLLSLNRQVLVMTHAVSEADMAMLNVQGPAPKGRFLHVSQIAMPSDVANMSSVENLEAGPKLVVERWVAPEPLILQQHVNLQPVQNGAKRDSLIAGVLAALLFALIALIISRFRAQMSEAGRLEQLVHLRTHALEAEVKERKQVALELQDTQNDLIQAAKLASLGQMSAQLSHEYNQPLAAIRAYTENAKAFLEKDKGERAVRNMDRIIALTDRMARLSQHLTRFARKPDTKLKEVVLEQVLSAVLSLLQARIENSQAKIITKGDFSQPVMGGQIRLEHVLMNLITNAMDAAGSEPARIHIAVKYETAYAVLSVSDESGGIPQDIIEKVFDPFFTTKDAGKGLGLGLSISYNIIEDFGGKLRVQNNGKGARFEMKLQRAKT